LARFGRIPHDTDVNQESLQRANAFLAAVAGRASTGELVDLSPAELGREIGVDEPLAAARAVRALLARRRLETVDGRYRLLDPRPIEPGEREQVPRPRRPRQRSAAKTDRAAEPGGRKRTAYSDIGREAVERLVELGREVGTLRGGLRTAREEAREAQARRDDAERRASTLGARVKELEARVEMAESNLRTLLAAAKGVGRDAPVGDTEMEAILGVLKGGAESERAEQREPEQSEPGQSEPAGTS
jgi:chromosome segregation ATPase